MLIRYGPAPAAAALILHTTSSRAFAGTAWEAFGAPGGWGAALPLSAVALALWCLSWRRRLQAGEWTALAREAVQPSPEKE